ncbi:MAG: nitrilase-related carbon-nitrogen hydrolase [Gammaproteobacteria bacterium]
MFARYDKLHLFDVLVGDAQGQYRESASIEPGDQPLVVATPLAQLGLTVCYDLRFPGLYSWLQQEGADIITVPSAFTYRTGEAHWEVLRHAPAPSKPSASSLHPIGVACTRRGVPPGGTP